MKILIPFQQPKINASCTDFGEIGIELIINFLLERYDFFAKPESRGDSFIEFGIYSSNDLGPSLLDNRLGIVRFEAETPEECLKLKGKIYETREKESQHFLLVSQTNKNFSSKINLNGSEP